MCIRYTCIILDTCFEFLSLGPPNTPTNLGIIILNISDTESSVNLTWSLDNQCVVVYHVEVTNTNTDNITNMNTTSQYIVLTLQTGVVYSFRVRGADSAGRGEWSELFMYTPGELKFIITVYICIVLTLQASRLLLLYLFCQQYQPLYQQQHCQHQLVLPQVQLLIYVIFSTLIVKPHTYYLITVLPAGAIAGIVVGIVVVVALVLIGTFLLSFCIFKKSKSVDC